MPPGGWRLRTASMRQSESSALRGARKIASANDAGYTKTTAKNARRSAAELQRETSRMDRIATPTVRSMNGANGSCSASCSLSVDRVETAMLAPRDRAGSSISTSVLQSEPPEPRGTSASARRDAVGYNRTPSCPTPTVALSEPTIAHPAAVLGEPTTHRIFYS